LQISTLLPRLSTLVLSSSSRPLSNRSFSFTVRSCHSSSVEVVLLLTRLFISVSELRLCRFVT
jgi:hypothetical protein